MKKNIFALLAEYKKAIEELVDVTKPINEQKLSEIVDQLTKDEDCKSIQAILSHVIQSGYVYIVYIENHLGKNKQRPPKLVYNNSREYNEQLNLMYSYSEDFFQQNPNIVIEELDNENKIITNWGQQYDIEQLLEHAIVHILRHRRQIEQFLIE